jgi:hypothetical protein
MFVVMPRRPVVPSLRRCWSNGATLSIRIRRVTLQTRYRSLNWMIRYQETTRRCVSSGRQRLCRRCGLQSEPRSTRHMPLKPLPRHRGPSGRHKAPALKKQSDPSGGLGVAVDVIAFMIILVSRLLHVHEHKMDTRRPRGTLERKATPHTIVTLRILDSQWRRARSWHSKRLTCKTIPETPSASL